MFYRKNIKFLENLILFILIRILNYVRSLVDANLFYVHNQYIIFYQIVCPTIERMVIIENADGVDTFILFALHCA